MNNFNHRFCHLTKTNHLFILGFAAKEAIMKNWRQALIILALYVFALGIRVYWLAQKEGLHVDEGLTIALACYNEFMVTKNYEYGVKYTGKELKEASLVSDASLKGAFSDIRSLWQDNRDPPHTNLYYTFLRLSLIGLKTGDIPSIIFRGGLLNLLFFTVSFAFFYRLMRLLFSGSRLLQYASTFCAFASTATISNTLFLRPYQIQETLFIIFCYYFVLSIGWRKYIFHENKLFINVKPIALLSLITALVLMSGYYALLFVGLFGLYAIYLMCRKKTFIEIPFYFVVLCFGIICAQILYPKYVNGFFSYRGQETLKTISKNIGANIRESITAAETLLHRHFFTYPVIAVVLACFGIFIALFIQQRLREHKPIKVHTIQKLAWFIFAASLLYLLVVLILAPYKVLRYGMPVFPFLIILPAIMINALWVRSQKIATGAMLLLCACFMFNATRESKIENIFCGKPHEYAFTEDKDTPVYVLNARWSLWKYANLIPYLHDEQDYYFIDWYAYFDDYMKAGQKSVDIEFPELFDYDSMFLLNEYFPDFPQLDGLVDVVEKNLQAIYGDIESEFEIYTGEPESTFPYFKGKKIRK